MTGQTTSRKKTPTDFSTTRKKNTVPRAEITPSLHSCSMERNTYVALIEKTCHVARQLCVP
ncbi:uncharacterized protein SETTUDRAFT_162221 [Exserohilum turcica Et28A]|uniref:Uncharacterized protein n=1 Tax=Exserohilum turcicum (strain 28A) TaxID=671987 RepID=R0J3H8_EXST2|nr:uncharacterized protein SETTUDRAFT_162221 [Exserohilum turcica Et28A]EOA91515.1 hypothetical protein SETTUDRAFT_162221 [Exserohilum turcica Et28A]